MEGRLMAVPCWQAEYQGGMFPGQAGSGSYLEPGRTPIPGRPSAQVTVLKARIQKQERGNEDPPEQATPV